MIKLEQSIKGRRRRQVQNDAQPEQWHVWIVPSGAQLSAQQYCNPQACTTTTSSHATTSHAVSYQFSAPYFWTRKVPAIENTGFTKTNCNPNMNQLAWFIHSQRLSLTDQSAVSALWDITLDEQSMMETLQLAGWWVGELAPASRTLCIDTTPFPRTPKSCLVSSSRAEMAFAEYHSVKKGAERPVAPSCQI